MHPTITLPPSWATTRADVGDRAVYVVDAGLRVEVDPLEPLPADRAAWCERVLRRELAAGVTVEQVGLADDRTAAGAPMTLVTTRLRGADGKVIEVRHTGFYELGAQGAVVACRLLSREAAAAVEPAKIEALFRSVT